MRDELRHRLKIAKDFSRGNSKRLDSLLRKPGVTVLIAPRVGSHIVRRTIDFDAERGFGTIKVQHVGTGRVLVAEFETAWAGAKNTPEQHFG